ncbi:MAG: PLP-dependent aminotransferase family protein [Clostridia bacterium]|nr:PLP-dependent aminotransferase family protein [Clostridia bacterium]
MNFRLSNRVTKRDFQGEFTAKILKAAEDPEIISFAGGLPFASSFPVKEIQAASEKVFGENPVLALQYNSAKGYEPLRQVIADRYKKTMDLDFSADDIIVTNGSQQALALIAAALIDDGDEVACENPCYLVALQTFHLYNPVVCPVELTDEGMNLDSLKEMLDKHNPKFMYMVTNFQNPTGITYTDENRQAIADLVKDRDIVVVEDNPYGELRFAGKAGRSMHYYLGKQCLLLGTFSKIASPGMRVGWIACKDPDMKAKLLNYKSAVDLHTNMPCQMILAHYMLDNDFEAHMVDVREMYRQKAVCMMDCLDKYLPEGVKFTRPEGGMFIWLTLPEGVAGVDVQDEALKRHVGIVAGDPFYEYDRNTNTIRLNYTNSTDEEIDYGIKALAESIEVVMNRK